MFTFLLFTLSLIETLSARILYLNHGEIPKSYFRSHGLRVHAGRDKDEDEFTYIVSMQLVNDNKEEDAFRVCTGSVVSPTWVLTAAHCTAIDVEPTEYMIIRYCDITAPFNNRTSGYSRILREEYHPLYKKADVKHFGYAYLEYDILLLLTKDTPINKLGRLSVIQYSALYGLSVQFAGYGDTDLINPSDSNNKKLQVGEGGVIQCDDKLLKKYKAKGPFICVIPRCLMVNQSILQGDSGGPLVYDGQIVAIATAILYNKYEPKHIDMFYTPISPYISWIKKITQGK